MFKPYKSFKIIFIYFAALQLRVVKNENIVKLLEITCESMQPQNVNFTQCKMEYKRGDVYEVTIAITLDLGPINNATLISSIVKRGYEDRQPMFEYKVDWCNFFLKKRRSFLSKIVYGVFGFERYSNMNHSCPYDHDLLVDHYPLDGKTVGKVAPFGKGIFTFITKWYAYNVLRAVVNIRFQTFDR